MNITIATNEGFGKFMQTVGLGLRNVRQSQQQDIGTVAEAVGIPDEQLDLMERGKFNWDVGQIERLCNYYNVTVKQLMSYSNDTQPKYLA